MGVLTEDTSLTQGSSLMISMAGQGLYLNLGDERCYSLSDELRLKELPGRNRVKSHGFRHAEGRRVAFRSLEACDSLTSSIDPDPLQVFSQKEGAG